jgi:pectate lyase
VVATGTAPLSYQWAKGGAAIAGATGATLTLAAVSTADAGSYAVTVSNAAGKVTSSPATLTVTAAAVAPAITTQPQAQTVTAGASVTLSVVATGTAPLSYQWAKGGAAIAGAMGATLTLAGVSAADAGSYTVTVSNSAGKVTSSAAALTVTAATSAPSITGSPASQSVTAGSDVTFAVSATGAAPLAYQWAKDGAAISGATGATLLLTAVSTSAAGSYTVTVSNASGKVTSSAAVLSVLSASDYARFDLTGFATVDAGTTGGGEIAETDAAYRKVTTPLELANALIAAAKTAGAVKVIEIMNDLDLGYTEVGAGVTGLSSTPFRVAATPQLHPVLKVTGVSVVDVKPKSGLTLFSANGATLRHATLNVKGTSNIIIRNLRFDEMWEWDEATKGNYDKNDWDFIDIGNGAAAHHVWVDHCTFTKSYDGILDIKGGAYAITMSWNKVVGDDGATSSSSFVRQQIAALEQCGATACPFWALLRANGFGVEDLAQILQGQDKTHLIGATELAAENASHTVTIHHTLFQNTWDRHPRLRAGNVHVYDVVVDDEKALAAKRLRDARVSAFPSAVATSFKSYNLNPPLNGSISTEGGAVLVERSLYVDSLWPLRNNQTDPTNAQYTGKIEARDSMYAFHEASGTVTSFRGNSTDPGAPFGPRQATAIPFSWNLAGGALPYAYTTDDPSGLRALLDASAGAGALGWPKANWLKVKY